MTNLIPEFIALMDEIGQYGFDKYGDDSFQARRLRGDQSRWMERVEAREIGRHVAAHYQMYLDRIPHDKFGTRKHQLAAAAFNCMMEFYFCDDAPRDTSALSGEQK